MADRGELGGGTAVVKPEQMVDRLSRGRCAHGVTSVRYGQRSLIAKPLAREPGQGQTGRGTMPSYAMPSTDRVKQDNAHLLRTQRHFRRAADVITDAWSGFPQVVAIAVIGSVAKPLWKEVPRFAPYRRRGIPLWHECKDLDLALWLDDLTVLGELRRAKAAALSAEQERQHAFGVADHQVDVFLFRPGSDAYLGRLCHFNRCPKSRPECAAPGCGTTPFMRLFPDFEVDDDILTNVERSTLYSRADGVRCSASNLPGPIDSP